MNQMPQPQVSGKKNHLSSVILFFLLALLFILLFVPLPYYQSEEVNCKPGQMNCPRIGWHWNAPLNRFVSGLFQSGSVQEKLCKQYGGNWVKQYQECERISKQQCNLMGGNFNECASPCRNDPTSDICIQLCVAVCKFP